MKTIQKNSVIEQLDEEKAKGKKFVVWEVNKTQAEQIKEKYRTEDEIIYIHTRLFTPEEQKQYPLLRQLHRAKKREYKDYIPLKRPTKKELKILEQFDIRYCVRNLRIHL